MKGAFCDSSGYWQAIFQEREEGSQKEFWLLYLEKKTSILKRDRKPIQSQEKRRGD